MSVIFATIHDGFIAMCADKQATNLTSLEPLPKQVTKIHLWSPSIGVGAAGNYFVGKQILEAIHDALPDGVENYSLEELSDYVFDTYQILRETYDFVQDEDYAECIFAGTLSTGNLGIIYTKVGGGNFIKETYDITAQPIVLANPIDISFEETQSLYRSAVQNTVGKKTRNMDVFEASLRKAVRYVSERSKYVGHKSDYFIVTPYKK